jgi:hypothetical protein
VQRSLHHLVSCLTLHTKLLILRFTIRHSKTLEDRLLRFSRIVAASTPLSNWESGIASMHLRGIIQALALRKRFTLRSSRQALLTELAFLKEHTAALSPVFRILQSKRVLFCGQAYYNSWYLSRALRKLGWKADLFDWDEDPSSEIFYHGCDFKFTALDFKPHPSSSLVQAIFSLFLILCSRITPRPISSGLLSASVLDFYVFSIYAYDVYHFANAHGICYGAQLTSALGPTFSSGDEIWLLKSLGKAIVYSNNGCLDGVSQSSFSKWGPESVCSICRWQNEPDVCSDSRNLAFGVFRNAVADYQCLLGGNRADYNISPNVHECPEFYCLKPDIWNPGIRIPARYRLSVCRSDTVFLYHAVGNKALRTLDDGVNIKSSHVYLPLVRRLIDEGLPVELLSPSGIPNREVRYIQAQADIFLEMLSYGWFGANAREAMMLAKPVICFIRPEWLETLRSELPSYADELPIVSATPCTVEAILRRLIADAAMRREIGLRCRDFALKWHSDQVAAKRFDEIYGGLLRLSKTEG